MNKFMNIFTGALTRRKLKKKSTSTALGGLDTVDLLEVLRKPSRSRTFPRGVGNDPKTKCKGTKKGATHFVRPAGQGLSN